MGGSREPFRVLFIGTPAPTSPSELASFGLEAVWRPQTPLSVWRPTSPNVARTYFVWDEQHLPQAGPDLPKDHGPIDWFQVDNSALTPETMGGALSAAGFPVGRTFDVIVTRKMFCRCNMEQDPRLDVCGGFTTGTPSFEALSTLLKPNGRMLHMMEGHHGRADCALRHSYAFAKENEAHWGVFGVQKPKFGLVNRPSLGPYSGDVEVLVGALEKDCDWQDGVILTVGKAGEGVILTVGRA